MYFSINTRKGFFRSGVASTLQLSLQVSYQSTECQHKMNQLCGAHTSRISYGRSYFCCIEICTLPKMMGQNLGSAADGHEIRTHFLRGISRLYAQARLLLPLHRSIGCAPLCTVRATAPRQLHRRVAASTPNGARPQKCSQQVLSTEVLAY